MDKREVWLEGESTFEVTKRKGRNFKVYIDQAFVEVKGTVFVFSPPGSMVRK